ncbi:MAG: SUMF1/EgtB/PvdO family nonheme iron enzyme [Planctomycetota bacterium]
MTPEHYRELSNAFGHALRLAPEQRDRFLQTLAAPLQENVKRLLARDQQLEDDPAATLTFGSDRRPGLETAAQPTLIDGYRILGTVGAGGMGSVYRAQEPGPYEREVALKILRQDAPKEATTLLRFKAEQQTLADLNHPHIASIFNAGTAEDGRLYLVMELVEGQHLTDYCRDLGLTFDDKLQLFATICDAVAYAHGKDVVHRDLKPSNLLVTTRDGQPVPKVIDFGIAKATGSTAHEDLAAHLTDRGFVGGTPQYMSPEQAGYSDLPVDHRTDVYSLGVVLFELLTGQLPIDFDEEMTLADVGRRIGEQIPVAPSSVAEPAVARRLRGDLDSMILRALQKDPAQRYESPLQLARDIRRHRRRQTVSARPQTVAYRLSKLVRRQPAGTVAIAVTAVALIAAVLTQQPIERTFAILLLLACAGGLVRHRDLLRRARDARHSEARLRGIADKQRRLANENRARAEEHYKRMLRLSDVQRLEDLLARQQELWPAVPELLPDFAAWLTEAEELAGRFDEHSEFLKRLRRDATYDADAKEPSYVFSTAENQWWHGQLTRLVDGLRDFTSDGSSATVAGMRRRIDSATTIRERSIDSAEAQQAWTTAIQAIHDSDRYSGLQLTPQIGLLPLRRDPTTGLWEFWLVESGRRPNPSPANQSGNPWIINEDTGIVLVLIPGGTFRMGAQGDDPTQPNYDAAADPEQEAPTHEITLEPFFLARYLMTQGQWCHISSNKNPSCYGPGRKYGDKQHTLQHPVETISWFEARDHLRRLGCELPTEAQWEYAARAGTATPWWTGTDATSLIGATNLADDYARRNGAPVTWEFEDWLDDGYVVHSPVGIYRPNSFGLHDIHGNVWEWCRDWHGEYSWCAAGPRDGYREPQEQRARVFRGGGFMHRAIQSRVSSRVFNEPAYRASSLGVRPMRSIR